MQLIVEDASPDEIQSPVSDESLEGIRVPNNSPRSPESSASEDLASSDDQQDDPEETQSLVSDESLEGIRVPNNSPRSPASSASEELASIDDEQDTPEEVQSLVSDEFLEGIIVPHNSPASSASPASAEPASTDDQQDATLELEAGHTSPEHQQDATPEPRAGDTSPEHNPVYQQDVMPEPKAGLTSPEHNPEYQRLAQVQLEIAGKMLAMDCGTTDPTETAASLARYPKRYFEMANDDYQVICYHHGNERGSFFKHLEEMSAGIEAENTRLKEENAELEADMANMKKAMDALLTEREQLKTQIETDASKKKSVARQLGETTLDRATLLNVMDAIQEPIADILDEIEWCVAVVGNSGKGQQAQQPDQTGQTEQTERGNVPGPSASLGVKRSNSDDGNDGGAVANKRLKTVEADDKALVPQPFNVLTSISLADLGPLLDFTRKVVPQMLWSQIRDMKPIPRAFEWPEGSCQMWILRCPFHLDRKPCAMSNYTGWYDIAPTGAASFGVNHICADHQYPHFDTKTLVERHGTRIIANGYCSKMREDKFRDRVIAETRELNIVEQQAKKQRLLDANEQAREYMAKCRAITAVVD
ncbi:hypothetical protein MAPG_01478 [Magnaporthiopsis poae ATCC 64411]|uniref:Uncharacterized protein n=1 Tax=Magnaporthiopsis poae (strain ATCC 64411 / 73-15) TaxID=644358 RepID=A0A0C4DNT3_MAGP6|nr:hypothetical protein MAPG_01478 [Magnaporthiopsis poae ATCC 64411]